MLQNRETALYRLREGVVGCDAQVRIAEIGLDPAGSDPLTPGQEVRDEALTVGDRLLGGQRLAERAPFGEDDLSLSRAAAHSASVMSVGY